VPAGRNRLFVALSLPEPARGDLHSLAREVAALTGGRPVAAANLHLTVRFLGAVPGDRVAALAEAVHDALAGPSIPLDPLRLRARPRASRARLVALEMEDPTGLLAGCADRVRAAVARTLDTDAELDDAPVWPHVTLVRLRRPAPVEGFPAVPGEAVVVRRAALLESLLRSGGPPGYREVVAVDLA
jgi:RNA 2',3'-cyclic 3'-phosphodiesterase